MFFLSRVVYETKTRSSMLLRRYGKAESFEEYLLRNKAPEMFVGPSYIATRTGLSVMKRLYSR